MFVILNDSVNYYEFSGVVNKSAFNSFVFNSSNKLYNASYSFGSSSHSSNIVAKSKFIIVDAGPVALINALNVSTITGTKNGSLVISRKA